MEKAIGKPAERLSVRREDLYLPDGPAGLEIVEITGKSEFAHAHVYHESLVFTPDSRRFIFTRYNGYAPDISWCKYYRQSQIFLCDMDDGYSVRQLTDENLGTHCFEMSIDGKYVHYLVQLTDRPGYLLKRVDIDTGAREVVMAVDKPFSGHSFVPTFYCLMSTRLDGKSLCIPNVINTPWFSERPYHLCVVLDLEKFEPRVILEGDELLGIHPQYSKNPERMGDISLFENHGGYMTCNLEDGFDVLDQRNIGNYGGDHHVVSDNSDEYRDLPWGRDGFEYSTGHSYWLGPTEWIVTSIQTLRLDGSSEYNLVAGKPISCPDRLRHRGRRIPGAEQSRVILTRKTDASVLLNHFAFDLTGKYFVSDFIPGSWNATPEQHAKEDLIVIGQVISAESPELDSEAYITYRPLCRTGCAYIDHLTHPHAAFSPDRKTLIFNSGEPGKTPQALVAHVTDDMFI